ncbi:MAG: hypothetical protein PHR16_09465, partial [Methylovulum sp.]|nr:hypothetical protein [Methylovulum sp.]
MCVINPFQRLSRCLARQCGRQAIAVGIALLCIPLAPASTTETVFFYNPESSVDNFAALKAEFDDYLSGKGGYSFQPFSERSTFESTLAGKPDGVYLLSSWHYAQLNSKIPLQAR